MKRVYVEWVDAYERFGWLQTEEAIKDCNPPMICKTTGWLVDENDERIIISHSYNDLCVMSGLHIPVRCIKKIKIY